MAYYAFLDENNIVTEVISGLDEGQDTDWEAFYSEFRGQTCKRTSYNTRGGIHYDPETNQPSDDQSRAFRKNYAGIGFLYDVERDAFLPEQPYASWSLNQETCQWVAPVPHPDDDGQYVWDEQNLTWVAVQVSRG